MISFNEVMEKNFSSNRSNFTLTDAVGRNLSSDWISSSQVEVYMGTQKVSVSGNLLWVRVPEPATATLSLLALAALAARRRRK